MNNVFYDVTLSLPVDSDELVMSLRRINHLSAVFGEKIISGFLAEVLLKCRF